MDHDVTSHFQKAEVVAYGEITGCVDPVDPIAEREYWGHKFLNKEINSNQLLERLQGGACPNDIWHFEVSEYYKNNTEQLGSPLRIDGGRSGIRSRSIGCGYPLSKSSGKHVLFLRNTTGTYTTSQCSGSFYLETDNDYRLKNREFESESDKRLYELGLKRSIENRLQVLEELKNDKPTASAPFWNNWAFPNMCRIDSQGITLHQSDKAPELTSQYSMARGMWGIRPVPSFSIGTPRLDYSWMTYREQQTPTGVTLKIGSNTLPLVFDPSLPEHSWKTNDGYWQHSAYFDQSALSELILREDLEDIELQIVYQSTKPEYRVIDTTRVSDAQIAFLECIDQF